MQQFIRGEQHSFPNAPRWVWTNLRGGEAVSFHLWCKHQRLKKPADFLSSVCVIEPSAHESSAGRDRKNEKQSSLLIFLNSCDHTYKHALLLHWWFSRTHDKLTLRWGSWVKINTTQWWSLPLWHVWESLSYVQAPGTDETKRKSIENGLKLFMKDLSIIPQITSPYSKAFLRWPFNGLSSTEAPL